MTQTASLKILINFKINEALVLKLTKLLKSANLKGKIKTAVKKRTTKKEVIKCL